MLHHITLRHAAVAVAVTAAVALSGCTDDKKSGGNQAAAAQQRATPVSVQEIRYEPIEMRTELSGRVTAFQTAEVRPQVSGILQSRLFEEGTEVKLGQQLYQIDPAVYEANLASAQASLLQAQASLVSAKADAKRSAELVKIKAVSASQNDQAQAAWKVAEANVAAARAAVKTAQINLQYTRVNS
ncbi:MAG: efflux RND transporter periplasmic adaptor subunit, partial [Duodenibacillus sp.]